MSFQEPRPLSCGLLVISPAGWLLAHATRTPRWDLPKGGLEDGETPLQAALREAWEEVGIDFSPWRHQMKDLGRHRYLKEKDLQLFLLRMDCPLDLTQCTCHTYIERESEQVPETDEYAWVTPSEIPDRVGRSLVIYLRRLGLLD